ncbi:MAG: GTP 3',8-cyclase MoaA [Clostridiales Family XIII bacterium]|jgi:cyclic pyranopterin phosphate synthase|nr:GTP 3',8-cyclase MoaA [Clostridiales Family XIII bacterium]
MIDKMRRDIHYLRLSVTDRCNLRCAYCMPADGVERMSHADILTFEEIEHLMRLLALLGVRRVKVTGGEPFVRRGTPELIRKLKRLPGIEQVTVTTNGILLKDHLDEIVCAGADGVNVSLDTLNRENYRRLTGADDLNRVLESVTAAAAALPVKLNVVPMRGVNEGELEGLAAMAKRDVVAVRFIELMPVGRAKRFAHLDTASVKAALEARFGAMEPCDDRLGNGPAAYFRLPGFSGRIGFIHAMSEVFCEGCNRVRLTADGRLMPCLGRPDFTDMKGLLRGGASGRALLAALERGIAEKPARHGFLDEARCAGRDMNEIGG